MDVGTDNETNVTDDYKDLDNRFTGKIAKVTIQVTPADRAAAAAAIKAAEGGQRKAADVTE